MMTVVVLLFSIYMAMVSSDGQMYRGEREASAAMNSASPYDFYGKPFYGKTTTDVIVQEGSHAFFHCLVHNLGNQTVSWVRNVDAHMLFIGRDRFVHDDRYELIPSRHGRWTLKLKYVTARDAGRFECQVSTVPKLNQTFSLKVVVPSVQIVGDREVHVKAGTSVTLKCLISNCLEEPAYVFWYHGERRLLDDDDQIPGDLVSPTPQPKLRQKGGTTFLPVPNTISPKEETLEVALSRGGISIVTRRLVADGSAMSTVSIQNPTPAHSGKYACRPANLDPAYVNLHVIQEEKPAAMQHENRIQSSKVSASSGTASNSKSALSSTEINGLTSSSASTILLLHSSSMVLLSWMCYKILM